MAFGEDTTITRSDRNSTQAAAPAERLSAKQIVVWGCLAGASVGAVALTAANIYTATGLDRGKTCHLTERGLTAASGRVLGVMSEANAAAMLASTQRRLKATITPAYVANRRAIILVSGAEGGRRVSAAVPKSLAIHVGDQVDFAYGYRDRSLPCSYVPNLIRDIAPIPKPE